MYIQNLVAIDVHTHLDTSCSLAADAAKASQEGV